MLSDGALWPPTNGSPRVVPSEVRTILFKQSEVIDALRIYRLRKGKPIPLGQTFKFVVEDDPGVRIALAVAVKGEERLEHCEFLAREIGAALVMHCIEQKIPLPANNATKALQIAGDCVALVVTIGAPTEQLGSFTKVG